LDLFLSRMPHAAAMSTGLESTPVEPGQVPGASRVARTVAGVVGVVAAVVAAVTIGAVLMRAEQPYWMVVGFEVVVLIAAGFAVGIARGKFRDGPGMALLCVAGTLMVAGVLGYISTKGTQGVLKLQGRSVPMKPWALLHLAGAGLMALLAAYEVLRRNSRSMYYIARGAMAGVPLAAIVGVAAMLYRKSQATERAYQSAVEAALMAGKDAPAAPEPVVASWVSWLGGSLAAVAALVLFSACAHCVIRAFEMGRATERDIAIKR
jgi:hypothetical protein